MGSHYIDGKLQDLYDPYSERPTIRTMWKRFICYDCNYETTTHDNVEFSPGGSIGYDQIGTSCPRCKSENTTFNKGDQ